MSTRLTQPLDAEEARLADELVRLGDALPPPALDSRIRAEAHAAVRRTSRVASRSVRRWGGALAAVLALGVGIKLNLEPTPLSPGMMPSDSSVSEQAAPSPVAANQAPASPAQASKNIATDVSQKEKQAELAAVADAESSLGRAEVQTAPIAERRNERAQDAEVAAAASDAERAAANSRRDEEAPVGERAPAKAFPPAAVIESKEAGASPAREADLRAPAAPDPIAPASAARPSATPVPAASLPAPAAFAPPARAPAENESAAQVKRQAFETNDAAEANSFGARSKAADAASDVQQLRLIALDELIREARQLAMSGNRDDLKRVLKQIARDYPEAQLPDDIRELIAADQPSR